MDNLGYKYETTAIESSPKQDKTIHYPYLHLTHKIPSNLINKNVGDKCKFYVIAEITSKSMSESDNKKNYSMDLDIQSIGYIEKIPRSETGKKKEKIAKSIFGEQVK
jgi:hypothetical protein